MPDPLSVGRELVATVNTVRLVTAEIATLFAWYVSGYPNMHRS